MTKQEIVVDFSDPTLYVDWVTEITEALYDPDIRYIFLKGGAGAGKSYAVVQLLVQNIMDSVRIGVFRKTATSLRASCLQLFKDVSSSRDLTNKYLDIKESKEIQNVNGEGLAMMFGLDDEEKIKSLANFDWFRVEETTEITMDDFTQLDLRLRGGNNHKIICTFNPISSRHRLKTQVEDKKRHDAKRIYKTAWDNKFIDERYLKNLEAMKDKNEAKYKIYALNQRGEAVEGLVYQQYTTFTHDIVPEVIGLDFGWNDPTAMVYLRREDVPGGKKKLYVQEKIYASELSSSDIITLLQKYKVPKNILIIADSARPEMISDIKKAGYHIIGVDKYAGSVKDQIANVQEYDLYVNGHNIEKEVATYMRKRDKNGQAMDVPVDGDDHCFVGNTKIITNKGIVKIKNLKNTHKVLTNEGYMDTVSYGLTGYKETYEYKISTDIGVYQVTCTPNHLFYTNRGWIQIDQLQLNDIVYLHRSSIEAPTKSKNEKATITIDQKDYTDKYGNTTMASYLNDIIFIISMRIQTTMIYQTLLGCYEKIIYLCTQNKGLKKTQNNLKYFGEKVLKPQKNDMALWNEKNDTDNIIKTKKTNYIKKLKKNVLFVIQGILHKIEKARSFVQINVDQNGEEINESIMKQDNAIVEKHLLPINTKREYIVQGNVYAIAKKYKGNQKVYDITVNEHHNFFADGFLVHNCMDSTRYGCTYFKKAKARATFI